MRKGRDFDAALRHWVDPDAYAVLVDEQPGRLRSPVEMFYLERGVDLHWLHILDNRKYLHRLIFKQLASGTLLSSAADDISNPSHPRVLVHPSLYDCDDITYDGALGTVTAAGRTLRNVEVFEPSDIPTNVTRFPDWLSQYSDQLLEGASKSADAAPETKEFHHGAAYRHVWLRGREFNLTAQQAEVVRVLHDAWKDGNPWRHVEELREAVGFESAKLAQVFRRLSDWRELILSDKRGHYRLKLQR